MLKVYLVKLNGALDFMNKTRQIFNINISPQQNQNPNT